MKSYFKYFSSHNIKSRFSNSEGTDGQLRYLKNPDILTILSAAHIYIHFNKEKVILMPCKYSHKINKIIGRHSIKYGIKVAKRIPGPV